MSTFRKCFDCILLRNKAEQLKLFAIENDDFYLYIQTYQGHVDNQFWDTIFDLKHTNEDFK